MLRALEDGKSEESALIIPKEIWRMVDHLYRFGLQQVTSHCCFYYVNVCN